ncbi:DUF4295 domain-containing protein [Natronogracilivirga saccharolytica]|uniref:DUF4295 domain-containing protein n=1 Tax=Natronogracilivirga saccharolytica TaxID=2812953 RepID=A0A8J7USJ0_9BACT|nr:DUF4295 domain-containing protein [Natronogracilivirga saccharolytica]MBP3191571.1 DUF4295 domain-containing protein [Natronogracilivirga saccharolytica]
MAKKQVFGEQVLAAKAAQRKMAKVIVSKKTSKGKIAFHESTVDQENVKDFISRQKS